MTLAKDGFPRITKRGIELIQQGLAGDFSGWKEVGYLNHPYEIPESELSCCWINASEHWTETGRPQFVVHPYFGNFPSISHHQGLVVVPDFEFCKLQTSSRNGVDDSDYIILTNGETWYTRVILLIEDRLAGKQIEAEEDEEEPEEEPEECCVEPVKSTQKGLEAWL